MLYIYLGKTEHKLSFWLQQSFQEQMSFNWSLFYSCCSYNPIMPCTRHPGVRWKKLQNFCVFYIECRFQLFLLDKWIWHNDCFVENWGKSGFVRKKSITIKTAIITYETECSLNKWIILIGIMSNSLFMEFIANFFLTWSDSSRISSRIDSTGRLLSLPRVKGTMQ